MYHLDTGRPLIISPVFRVILGMEPFGELGASGIVSASWGLSGSPFFFFAFSPFVCLHNFNLNLITALCGEGLASHADGGEPTSPQRFLCPRDRHSRIALLGHQWCCPN